jgi:hypothetical protein
VLRDAAGQVTELRCVHDPSSRSGNPADGRRVKGTIHWLSTQSAVPCEVRLYERLFSDPEPDRGKGGPDFTTGQAFWGTQSAEWWGPMAVAVVFGLAFATLLTLVVVPSFYVLFDDFHVARRTAKSRLGGMISRFSAKNRTRPSSESPAQ